MNETDLLNTSSIRINQFFKLMLLGFTVASAYHLTLHNIGFGWPWSTFLFIPGDRFNDWYHSVVQAASISPYFDHSTPALAAYFPVSYLLLKASGSGDSSIYTYFSISLALLIAAAGLGRSFVNPRNLDLSSSCRRDVALLVVASFVSYPVVFALDRGNLDLWVALLSVVFVVTMHTNLRLMGLFALSLAIAIKGYSAIFILLLVADRKYRSAILCLTLAILMSLLTLFFMWDGFAKNLSGFKHNLDLYYQYYVLGPGSLFASSDPYNAIRLIYFWIYDQWHQSTFFGVQLASPEVANQSILKIYSLFSSSFAVIAGFFVVFVRAARWKKVTAICLIAILFPNVANDYKLCNLLPGLYLLLFETRQTRPEKVSFVLFCLLMIPKSYLFIQGKPISMLLNPVLLFALAYQVMGDRQSWQRAIRLQKLRILWQIELWKRKANLGRGSARISQHIS